MKAMQREDKILKCVSLLRTQIDPTKKYSMKNGAEFITVIKARKFSCKDKKPYEQRNGFPFLKAFV